MKLNKSIILVLLLSAIIVVVSTYYSISNSRQAGQYADRAFISQHQISRIERLYALTANADEGVKNYIVTGNEKFLVPSDSSYARIKRTVNYLMLDIKDDSTLSRNTRTVVQHVNTQIHFIDWLASARKVSFDSAQHIVSSGKGITLMDSLRALVARTTSQERLERTQFTAQNQASVAKTTMAIIIDEIIAFIIIILILFKLNRDITKRIASEKLVKESEIKYRAIALNIKSFIYTCDYYGKINFVTPNIVALTGYTPDQIVGKDFTFMVAPEMVETVKQAKYTQFKNKIREETSEFEIITKDGQRKMVEQEVIIFSTEDMQMGFQCTIRDISGQDNKK